MQPPIGTNVIIIRDADGAILAWGIEKQNNYNGFVFIIFLMLLFLKIKLIIMAIERNIHGK